jgi:hypothetical protein
MERSIIAFEHYRQAEQKFEYFITGLTCTFFAFLAKDFSPQALGRPESAELLSLVLLLASIYFGFKRIDFSIRVMHMNHEFLDAQEKRGNIVSNFTGQPMVNALSGDYTDPAKVPAIAQDQAMRAEAAMSVLKKYQDKSKRCYDYRSLFLILGFVAVVVARVVRAIA